MRFLTNKELAATDKRKRKKRKKRPTLLDENGQPVARRQAKEAKTAQAALPRSRPATPSSEVISAVVQRPQSKPIQPTRKQLDQEERKRLSELAHRLGMKVDPRLDKGRRRK